MDEREFADRADRTLSRLQDALEAALGADDPEIELRGGILTVELADGGQFVLNKHGPTRQVWLSSPVSGASHFAWDETGTCWRSTRGPDTLEGRLSGDLATAVGHAVSLDS
ncbi:MAG: iron donor protein CyaY [Alphaproteobacteria bacterium]|nr:iron donor protein CyaY [Alphaproteobacteria bacterium]